MVCETDEGSWSKVAPTKQRRSVNKDVLAINIIVSPSRIVEVEKMFLKR